VKDYGLKLYGLHMWFCSRGGKALSLGIWIDENNTDEFERWTKCVDNTLSMVLKLGGVISTHYGIGPKQTHIRRMQEQYGPALEVMRLIKNLLDPNNIMNPGKKIPLSSENDR